MLTRHSLFLSQTLVLVVHLVAPTGSSSEDDDASRKCRDGKRKLIECWNPIGAAAFPNPFQECLNGAWPQNDVVDDRCFKVVDIAYSKRLLFRDIFRPTIILTGLTDDNCGTYATVGRNANSTWEVDLRRFYYVYGVIITSQGNLSRRDILVETGFRTSSRNGFNLTFRPCELALHRKLGNCGPSSYTYIFYCLNNESTAGIVSQVVRVNITNNGLVTHDPGIDIPEIKIFENKGMECGRPGGSHRNRAHHSPDRESYPVGSHFIYNYSCTAETSVQLKRICQIDGTWSGTAPTCDNSKCPMPDAPPRGSVDYTDDDVFGSVKATYSCDPGYNLSSSNQVAYCHGGRWDLQPPVCERIYCSHPEEEDESYWTLENATTVEGSRVVYTSANQSETWKVCDQTGTWVPTIVDSSGSNTITNGTRETNPTMAFVSQNYWVVVLPFVVLCVVASLCVTYQEQLKSWYRKRFRSPDSRGSSATRLTAEDMQEMDNIIIHDPASNHIYERISLLVPPPEMNDLMTCSTDEKRE